MRPLVYDLELSAWARTWRRRRRRTGWVRCLRLCSPCPRALATPTPQNRAQRCVRAVCAGSNDLLSKLKARAFPAELNHIAGPLDNRRFDAVRRADRAAIDRNSAFDANRRDTHEPTVVGAFPIAHILVAQDLDAPVLAIDRRFRDCLRG